MSHFSVLFEIKKEVKLDCIKYDQKLTTKEIRIMIIWSLNQFIGINQH
jgi:hypothetical protein